MSRLKWNAALGVVAALTLWQLDVRAAEVSLQNGGFESPAVKPDAGESAPADWVWFSSMGEAKKIALSTAASHGGKQSARFTIQGSYGSYQGVFESLAVTPGTTYEFTVYVRNDTASPLAGSTRGQISIEWKDENSNEIERNWGPDWGAAMSASSDKWTKFEMTGTAPANAARAHFVVTQFDGQDSSAGGAFFADDAAVKSK